VGAGAELVREPVVEILPSDEIEVRCGGAAVLTLNEREGLQLLVFVF
jgi:hypothetical protein